MSNKLKRKLIFFCLILFECAPLVVENKISLISDVELQQEIIENGNYLFSC